MKEFIRNALFPTKIKKVKTIEEDIDDLNKDLARATDKRVLMETIPFIPNSIVSKAKIKERDLVIDLMCLGVLQREKSGNIIQPQSELEGFYE